MRLYTMYYICKNNIEILKNTKGTQNNPNVDAFRVSNWEQTKKSLENLYSIECLKTYVKNIYDTVPVVFVYQPYIDFNNQTLQKFMKEIGYLIISASSVIDLYESLGYDDAENALEVQIPGGLELKKLADMIDDLNFIFNQCPLVEKDSTTSNLLRTDVGSIWLILVGTTAFLTSVGYLMSVTVKAKADIVGIKQAQAIYHEMDLKGNSLETVTNALKEQEKIIMNKYVKELEDMTGKELNPEEEDKVEKCIEKLDDLINTGVKIYAAIDTPREVQILFPEQPELKNISENMIKLIEKIGESQ